MPKKKLKFTLNATDEGSNVNILNIPEVGIHAVDKTGKKLNNVKIPICGLGTYKFKKGSGDAHRAVLDALSVGIRLIDTAFVYGGERTEAEIGEALSSDKCPVARSQIFLTTKQWRSYHGYHETLKMPGTQLEAAEDELHRFILNTLAWTCI